jgi:hypothetical protein
MVPGIYWFFADSIFWLVVCALLLWKYGAITTLDFRAIFTGYILTLVVGMVLGVLVGALRYNSN